LNPGATEKAELRAAIARVLQSPSRRKLVVAGPGTGKTTLFKEVLKARGGDPGDHLVLTFINNLKNDLELNLKDFAKVFTLHGYCFGLLHQHPGLRVGLSSEFVCLPRLATLIRSDWQHMKGSEPPHFVREMRNLGDKDHIAFYLTRGNYYDAVDFDDGVYRTHRELSAHPELVPIYDLVLIDEYQDFNALEAGFIELLAERSPILIAGDDDQALYSQLRDSSWDHIRSLHRNGTFEVFELPFCMRCPKVVVDAVNDVIVRAQQLRKLEGRIEKPYRHFPPAKAADSQRYPTIALVATTVQRQNANYMGRYIESAIAEIPAEEIDAAEADGFPAILVIVAKPYRTQIIAHLQARGYVIDTKRDIEEGLDRTSGLEMLKVDPDSNLGWRVVLESEPSTFSAGIIIATGDGTRLSDLVPEDYRRRVLEEAEAYVPEPVVEQILTPKHGQRAPVVRVTSFEGAKGLSAQHVFIAGLHDGEIPRDPDDIKDIEICRFLVGLTRTRKKCSLMYTQRFADKPKAPSRFLSWIRAHRLERIRVDARYWREKPISK
jgi:superfamily I DNA/RNA helicase